MRSYKPVVKGNHRQIRKAIELMAEAKRPVIYTGGGVILGKASEALRQFVHQTGFPITSTLMGLGAYPSPDPQFLGMLGMHGTYEANMAMHNADLILALGARLDDRVTNNVEKFCPRAQIVHVDIDPTSISKTVRADVPVVGPISQVLSEFNQLIVNGGGREKWPEINDWWSQIAEWRSRDCLAFETSCGLVT